MKYFLQLILILMCLSCSNNIEDEAMEHLKIMMKEMVFQSDKAELINTHTVYKADSICIIAFTLKAPNGNDIIVTTSMEYVYVDFNMNGKPFRGETITIGDNSFFYSGSEEEEKVKNELSDLGFDLSYIINNTVLNVKNRYRNELIKWANHDPNHPNIEDKLIFSAAWLKMMVRGREVSLNKGKDIKL